jgi:hypothetical protein
MYTDGHLRPGERIDEAQRLVAATEHALAIAASDSPFDPEKRPGYIRATIENIESLGLSDSEREQLYEGNARKVLRVAVARA